MGLNCDTSSNRRPASFTEQSHLARQGRGGWRRGTHTGSRLRRLGDTERVPATGSGLAELHGGRGDGEPPPQPPSRGHGETAGGGDERGTVPRDGDGDRAGRGERSVRARGGGGDCCGDGGQLHGRRGAEESEADDPVWQFVWPACVGGGRGDKTRFCIYIVYNIMIIIYLFITTTTSSSLSHYKRKSFQNFLLGLSLFHNRLILIPFYEPSAVEYLILPR